MEYLSISTISKTPISLPQYSVHIFPSPPAPRDLPTVTYPQSISPCIHPPVIYTASSSALSILYLSFLAFVISFTLCWNVSCAGFWFFGTVWWVFLLGGGYERTGGVGSFGGLFWGGRYGLFFLSCVPEWFLSCILYALLIIGFCSRILWDSILVGGACVLFVWGMDDMIRASLWGYFTWWYILWDLKGLFCMPGLWYNDITPGNDSGRRDFGHCYTETCTAPKCLSIKTRIEKKKKLSQYATTEQTHSTRCLPQPRRLIYDGTCSTSPVISTTYYLITRERHPLLLVQVKEWNQGMYVSINSSSRFQQRHGSSNWALPITTNNSFFSPWALVRTASWPYRTENRKKPTFLTEKKLVSAELGFFTLLRKSIESHHARVDARCFACCRAGRSGSNFGS